MQRVSRYQGEIVAAQQLQFASLRRVGAACRGPAGPKAKGAGGGHIQGAEGGQSPTWRSSADTSGWYMLSPSRGQATADSWARIWWVRPVSSSIRHSWHAGGDGGAVGAAVELALALAVMLALALTPQSAAAASVSLHARRSRGSSQRQREGQA